jgi:signal transduction histidine kinase
MAPVVGTARGIHRRHGPRVRDGAVVAFGLVMTLLAAKTPWSPVAWPIILAAGSAGSVVLWWRRRWPVPTTLVGAVAFPLSGNPVPLFVGLFTLAGSDDRRARRGLDGLLAAAVLVGAVAIALPDMIDLGRFDLQALVGGAALAGLAAVAGFYAGTRQALLVALQDRAERAEAERELRDEQARAGERARIAREMHDVLAHKVSLIALHAGALEVNRAADPDRVEEVAGVIRTTARQTLEELRAVLGLLRADGGTDVALTPQLPDIRQLVDASHDAGVPAELRCDLPDPDLALPDVTARAVHRVVQEGLTNVHKHAPGAATVVTLAGDRRFGVTVAVVNQPAMTARPGSVLPGAGAGLVGLRERMRLVGGTLRSGPEPGGGWRLEARLPWPDPDRAGAARTEPTPT